MITRNNPGTGGRRVLYRREEGLPHGASCFVVGEIPHFHSFRMEQHSSLRSILNALTLRRALRSCGHDNTCVCMRCRGPRAGLGSPASGRTQWGPAAETRHDDVATRQGRRSRATWLRPSTHCYPGGFKANQMNQSYSHP